MKKIFIVFPLVISSFILRAQVASVGASSNRIAQNLKDTLSLSNEQAKQIYEVNMKIYQQKQELRQKYKISEFARTDKQSKFISSDSLGIYMYKLEMRRDSLYKLILAPDKYQLYQQKKVTVINSE